MNRQNNETVILEIDYAIMQKKEAKGDVLFVILSVRHTIALL